LNTKLTADNRRQTKEILQELFGSVYRLEPRGVLDSVGLSSPEIIVASCRKSSMTHSACPTS